jgi:hypothetical protein
MTHKVLVIVFGVCLGFKERQEWMESYVARFE